MGAGELPAILGRNHPAAVVYAPLYQRIAGIKIVLRLYVDNEGELLPGAGDDGAEPGGENYDGILRMLDVLLSNETSEAEKRKILQDDYDIQMTQTMEREVSVMCNLSKGIRHTGKKSSGNSSICPALSADSRGKNRSGPPR